jgi:hypothetical protein
VTRPSWMPRMIAMLITLSAWWLLWVLYLSWLAQQPGELKWRRIFVPQLPRFRFCVRFRRVRIKEIMFVVLIVAIDAGLTMAMCPRQVARGCIAADLGTLAIVLTLGSFVALTQHGFAVLLVVISIVATGIHMSYGMRG